MPSCAVITCRARSQVLSIDKGGVSFHRFPKDPAIRAQWIAATGREDWIPTKYSTICSAHFTQNDYEIKKTGKKYLLDGAIPHEKIVYIQSLVGSAAEDLRVDNQVKKEEAAKADLKLRVHLQDCGVRERVKEHLDYLLFQASK